MHIQVIRLWPRRPPDGAVPLGLCCDAEGLSLGPGSPLIRRTQGPDGRPCYRARSLFEVNAILSVGYGTEIDAWPIYGKLEQIAAWMTGGEWTMASLAALHLRLPALADGSVASIAISCPISIRPRPTKNSRRMRRSMDRIRDMRTTISSNRGAQFLSRPVADSERR